MKLKPGVWLILAVFLGALAWIAYKIARDKKAAAYAAATPYERGWMLIEDKACTSCHQPGSSFRAPVLNNLWGKTVKLADGSEIVADEAYIKESIIAPMTRVVAGYQPVMPNYQGQFSDDELNALIAAMKTPEPH
ncbi:MAG: cytochrome c, partial [Pseudobdellovibrionaceae bacterium]|nr:cytochrome c [Pseudobdellovibrionaceae bacterium]